MDIVRAQASDWERLRDIRLRALLDTPEAFGSTYAEEVEEDEKAWRAWATGWTGAADQALFAALENGFWVGIALGVRWQREPGNLYAMWVEPSSRRLGVGRVLVKAVTRWARGIGTDRTVLRVTEGIPPRSPCAGDAGSLTPASAIACGKARRTRPS